MKIINIILMMSASFGLVYGQSINLDQTGSGHEVIIHQIGDNEINIEHSGSNQSAEIYQKGNENFSNVKQNNLMNENAISGNEALILQIGDANLAEIIQAQSGGMDNYGEIRQYGDRNKASIMPIRQGNEEFINTQNSARIFQYGNDNLAQVEQIYMFNVAELTQIGDFNGATVFMTGDNMQHAPNTVKIRQEGDKNSALANLGNFAATGEIEQLGDYNWVSQGLGVYDNGGRTFGSIKQHQNHALAEQGSSGSGSYLSIYQAASDPDATNYNYQQVFRSSVAIANVYGGGNWGEQRMSASYNYSRLEQDGDYNNTKILQNKYSSAYVQTYGEFSSHNVISVNQGWNKFSTNSNSASVYIEGAYNNASITQEGIGNIAGISIDNDSPYILPFGIEIIGDHNEASILQQGDQNSADLHLIGDNMVLNIDQVGNNMTTSITQEN